MVFNVLRAKATRRTTEQAEEVMFLDLPSRLATALMPLVDAESAGTRERFALRQHDIARAGKHSVR
jgi:hypothetical protein